MQVSASVGSSLIVSALFLIRRGVFFVRGRRLPAGFYSDFLWFNIQQQRVNVDNAVECWVNLGQHNTFPPKIPIQLVIFIQHLIIEVSSNKGNPFTYQYPPKGRRPSTAARPYSSLALTINGAPPSALEASKHRDVLH
jgi:hypothetical protein